jgi:hypothetical protein
MQIGPILQDAARRLPRLPACALGDILVPHLLGHAAEHRPSPGFLSGGAVIAHSHEQVVEFGSALKAAVVEGEAAL